MTFFTNSFSFSSFEFFRFSFSVFFMNREFLLKGDDGYAKSKSKNTGNN